MPNLLLMPAAVRSDARLFYLFKIPKVIFFIHSTIQHKKKIALDSNLELLTYSLR